MKVKLLFVSVIMAAIMTACSDRDNTEKTQELPKNTTKVEEISEKEQLSNKVKDMQDIIKMSLEQAYKSDEKLKVLEPDVMIDPSGRTVALIYNIDVFIDNFNVDRQIAKNYFISQVTLEQWGWIKDRCFDYYGKQAGMNTSSDITIVIVNKNDNKELKRF